MARRPLFLRSRRRGAERLLSAMASDEYLARLHPLHQDARAIFSHALDACRIERAFEQRVRLEDTTLIVEQPPLQPLRIDLRNYRSSGSSRSAKRPSP